MNHICEKTIVIQFMPTHVRHIWPLLARQPSSTFCIYFSLKCVCIRTQCPPICDSTAQNESHVPLIPTEHATHFVQLSHIYEHELVLYLQLYKRDYVFLTWRVGPTIHLSWMLAPPQGRRRWGAFDPPINFQIVVFGPFSKAHQTQKGPCGCQKGPFYCCHP